MCAVDALPSRTRTSEEPIGLYVHLPFCVAKCGYCDFYSEPLISDLVGEFARAIRRELALRDPGRPVAAVFVGGGTPTVLPNDALASILDAVRALVDGVAEFTVEANPAHADGLKLGLLREMGVNRLSLGAQSFHADELAVLERRHAPSTILDSVAAAREAGFVNVNLDLIYGVPGQTLERWHDTLRQAIDLAPEHLSCYGLTYEPGTPLTRQRDACSITPADEDLETDMFESTIEMLAGAGFEHYEISNFAKPGKRCRANIIYWENRAYLGVGPSAVSYLDGVRSRNVPDVREYVRRMQTDPGAVVIETERLDARRRAGETAVQMLRLTEGIRVGAYQRLAGFDPLHLFESPIRRFTRLGLLEATRDAIRLTPRGLLLANRVMSGFLLDPSPNGRP